MFRDWEGRWTAIRGSRIAESISLLSEGTNTTLLFNKWVLLKWRCGLYCQLFQKNKKEREFGLYNRKDRIIPSGQYTGGTHNDEKRCGLEASTVRNLPRKDPINTSKAKTERGRGASSTAKGCPKQGKSPFRKGWTETHQIKKKKVKTATPMAASRPLVLLIHQYEEKVPQISSFFFRGNDKQK